MVKFGVAYFNVGFVLLGFGLCYGCEFGVLDWCLGVLGMFNLIWLFVCSVGWLVLGWFCRFDCVSSFCFD